MAEHHKPEHFATISHRISESLRDGTMPIIEAAEQLNALATYATKMARRHEDGESFKRCDEQPLDRRWLHLEANLINAAADMVLYVTDRLEEESMKPAEASNRLDEVGCIFTSEAFAWRQQYITPMPVAA